MPKDDWKKASDKQLGRQIRFGYTQGEGRMDAVAAGDRDPRGEGRRALRERTGIVVPAMPNRHARRISKQLSASTQRLIQPWTGFSGTDWNRIILYGPKAGLIGSIFNAMHLGKLLAAQQTYHLALVTLKNLLSRQAHTGTKLRGWPASAPGDLDALHKLHTGARKDLDEVETVLRC